MKLAQLLALDEIDEDAHDKATAALLDLLHKEYARIKETEHFKSIVKEKGKLTVRTVNWRFGTELGDEDETVELDISAENINDLFDVAGRTFGEGLNKLWWKARVAEGTANRSTGKLEVFALSQDEEIIRQLKSTARALTLEWLSTHRTAIAHLPEGHEQAYTEIRRLASDPEETHISYPQAIEVLRSAQHGGNTYTPTKMRCFRPA